ncbi:MAG: M20 family metallopeptidase [candidate division NC10 bacterium]|nr:M20 family metallopeptidase [candidate division NC10 bacterium]
MMEISPEVKALSAEMTSLRRDLHAHPELGFQEVRTAGIIAKRLTGLGYTVRTGLGKTGVTGLLRGGKPGKTVLLRADIDALPIREEAVVPWRSETAGVMHACGHDAHTAMGLAAAAILAKEAPSLAGDLFFVFQPAEELLIGAEAMLEDGALEGVRADAAFAIHVMNRWPTGTVAICDGAAMTSADKLTLTITGRGGHGASPHLAIDPIVASAQIITALQTLVSRETPPLSTAVLSLTTLKAGTAFNIIPDAVEMTGTLRCFDAALREKLLASLRRTAEGLAASLRCTARVESQFLTPALRNDPAVTAVARQVAAMIVGESRVVAAEPLTGSDDVAYFFQKVPGCYAFVGSAKPEWSSAPASHNAKFDIDESALEIGADFLVRAARAALLPR